MSYEIARQERIFSSNNPYPHDHSLHRKRASGNGSTGRDISHVKGPGLSVDSRGQIAVIWFTGGDKQGLYYAASVNHGASYSPRKFIESSQNMGKHAQAVALSDGRVFVAWDEKMEKVKVVGGLLDLQKGLLQKSVLRDEASYPVIAFNGKTVVIARMQSAPQDIWMQSEP